MKLKQILVSLAVFALCIVAPNVQAQTPMDFLQQEQSITIVVDCMDEALVRMGTMPGFELSSRIYVVDGWGQAVRMVQNSQIDDTLILLRGLGYVVHSESQATNVFSRWAGLTAEFQVRNREYARLMELLYDATTMSQFNQIEDRLQRVIAGQERIQGQINNLELSMGSAQIAITLIQYEPEIVPYIEPEPEEEPEYEEPSRLRRIADAFMNSANGTFSAIQAILVFLALVSLPMVAIVIVGIVGFRVYKRKAKKRMNTGHVTGAEEGEDDDKN